MAEDRTIVVRRSIRRAVASIGLLAFVGWLLHVLTRRRRLTLLSATDAAPAPEPGSTESSAMSPVRQESSDRAAARQATALPAVPVSKVPGRVFISYRVAADAELVEKLHDKLRVEGVDVWWDKKCLAPGQPWEDGFAAGLMSSDVFVPILSKKALAPFAALQAGSECDNVLLEYRLACELKARAGELRAIFPVFVGELEDHGSLGEGYGDFFAGGGKPQAPGVRVFAVESKVEEHLLRGGNGSPMAPTAECTVKGVLDAICKHQGVFLKGAPKGDAVEKVVGALARISSEATPETSSSFKSAIERPLALPSSGRVPLPEGKKFVAFLSHSKADCSMEARFVQEKLESTLGQSVFLDSDKLIYITNLKQHVRESSVLILLQSKSVLTRPYCLLELLTALTEGVPIVGLAMVGGSGHYDYAENLKLLTHLDTNLDRANPEASNLLKAEGWADITQVAYLLANTIPSTISISFQAGSSRNALAASLDDLVETMAHAKAADLDALPPKMQWLEDRGRIFNSRSLVAQHGSIGATVPQGSSLAAIPLEVPTLPPNAVERPELIHQLLELVLHQRGAGGEVNATALTAPARRQSAQQQKLASNMTSANGMGGVGKTTAASAFVRNDLVRSKFQKLCWVSVGSEPGIIALQQGLHRQLVGLPLPEAIAADEKLALTALKEAANELSVLLVLDDVWSAEHARLLNFIDPSALGSAVLVTTRIRSLLGTDATDVQCEVLSKEDALQLLLRAGGVEHLLEDRVPDAALEAVEACFRLPLTLSIAGAIISELRDSWQQDLVPMLQMEFDEESVEQRVVMASLSVVPEAMRAGVEDLFMLFAVFPEDASVPAAAIDALAPLMGSGGAARKREVRRWLGQLLKANILCGSVENGVSVHDLVRDCMIHRVEIAREGGMRAMQRSVLLVLMEALQASGHHEGTKGPLTSTQQLKEYTLLHLRHHVSGAIQPEVQVQDDELLMRALCIEGNDVRVEAAHGIGRERLEAAILACEASGRWLEAGELLWTASVQCGQTVVAGQTALLRAREALQHVTESETSLRLEQRVLHAFLETLSGTKTLSQSEQTSATKRYVEVSQAVAGNQVEALLSEALAAQQTVVSLTFKAAGADELSAGGQLQQAMHEALKVSTLRRKAAEVASGHAIKAAAIRRNARVPLSFPHLHVREGWSWETVGGIDGVDIREDIIGYAVADHVEAKAFKGDLFMWGYHGVGTLLWQGDLETTHTFFAKTIDAWKQIAANVRAGTTTWDKYTYEVNFSCTTIAALAFSANKIDVLIELRKHHLTGLVLTDETLLSVYQRMFATSGEALLLQSRAIDALLKPNTSEVRIAIQEWLPGTATLIEYANTDGTPKIFAAFPSGPAHPALLCARLHGERLGNWQLAAEVAQAMGKASANPYNRIEALRLLSRATNARGTACKALEQALGDARMAGYAWCEMLVLHDMLGWVDPADAEAVASTREQLRSVIARLRCGTSDLSTVLGVDVESLLQG